MIQDLSPLEFDNAYKPKAPAAGDEVIAFCRDEVLLKADDKSVVSYPTVAEFGRSDLLVYAFSLGDKSYYLYRGDEAQLPNILGFSLHDLKLLRRCAPKKQSFVGFTARHLDKWYRSHLFCGTCGNKLTHHDSMRALLCPKCKTMYFPVLMPAIIVALSDGDKLLMTRYKDRPYRGLALIAGFCEIGETPEQTVRREIKEEVGLECEEIVYRASQPWGIDCNLLMGYTAKVKGSNLIVREESELSEAMWIPRDEIPYEEDPLSLTQTLVRDFAKGRI